MENQIRVHSDTLQSTLQYMSREDEGKFSIWVDASATSRQNSGIE